MNMDMNNDSNIITNTNVMANADEDLMSNPPETKYSNRFMDIARLVQQGKTPSDVKKIDDMPPDPHAPPSKSKLVQQKNRLKIMEMKMKMKMTTMTIEILP